MPAPPPAPKKARPVVDTAREVEVGNACVVEMTRGTSIHGMFRQVESAGEYPIVSAGLHCTACERMAGGSLDFSGEVGPTDGVGVAHSLMRALSNQGCPHAAAICVGLPPPPPVADDDDDQGN